MLHIDPSLWALFSDGPRREYPSTLFMLPKRTLIYPTITTSLKKTASNHAPSLTFLLQQCEASTSKLQVPNFSFFLLQYSLNYQPNKPLPNRFSDRINCISIDLCIEFFLVFNICGLSFISLSRHHKPLVTKHLLCWSVSYLSPVFSFSLPCFGCHT